MILWEGSEADAWLEIDMENKLHLQMKPKALRDTRPSYKLFSIRRFSKQIDQKKEAAKPYGQNPMQTAAKAAKKEKKDKSKVKDCPAISRVGIIGGYDNTT